MTVVTAGVDILGGPRVEGVVEVARECQQHRGPDDLSRYDAERTPPEEERPIPQQYVRAESDELPGVQERREYEGRAVRVGDGDIDGNRGEADDRD